MFGAFGARCVHRLGNAIKCFNRAARRLERGLSLVCGRLLDNPEMTEEKQSRANSGSQGLGRQYANHSFSRAMSACDPSRRFAMVWVWTRPSIGLPSQRDMKARI